MPQPITLRLPTKRPSLDRNNPPPPATFEADDANTWAPALLYDHTQPFRSVALQIAQIASAGTASAQSLWSLAVLQEELLRTVAEILSDGYICGFTKEEITHPAGAEFHREIFLPYLVSLLRISVVGLHFLTGHCKHSEHRVPRGSGPCAACNLMSTLLVPFGSGFGSFLRALWAIVDPFLRQESGTVPAGVPKISGGLPRTLGEVLRQNCMVLVQIIFTVSSETLKRQLAEQAYYGAHLTMFMWLYATKSVVKRGAADTLDMILTVSFPDFTKTRAYSKFFKEVTAHGISPREIYTEVLFDMVEDVDSRDSMSSDLYGMMVGFASQLRLEDTISLNSHTERALLWYSLSAGRRELCSVKIDPKVPEEQKLHHDDQCAMKLCCYLCQIFGREAWRGEAHPPYVPELWIYAVLVMFARHLFSDVQYINVTLRKSKDTLIPALRELGRSLRYYRVHPNPSYSQPWRRRPPPSLRIFALDWLIQAQKELKEVLPGADPLLRTTFTACVQLYRDLDSHHKSMVPHEVADVQDFEPLERCAWEECTCTVFRPLHSLKKCTGCHMAAYCNLRCQKRDWENHKSSCRRASNKRCAPIATALQ